MAQSKYRLHEVTEDKSLRLSFKKYSENPLRVAVAAWNKKHSANLKVEKLQIDKVFLITKN